MKRKELFDKCPIPRKEILNNLCLFLSSKNLSRILFFEHLYKQILDVQGVAMEFGTRWGNTISLLAALRGMYEPFNRLRTLVAFDTFQGISKHDENDSFFKEGDLKVTEFYENYLMEIMFVHEAENPMSHVKKFEIIKGDVLETFPEYLARHPETVVSFAFFDMDIYKPTKQCLELLKERLTRGAIVAFDEVNDPLAPGETLALHDVFGLNKIHLKRFLYNSRCSYFIVE